MADRYWVGGSGTWDATTTTNWSATSGGAGGASAPTSVDNAIFDSASNATLYTVTVGINAVCNDLTAAGPLTGNVTFSLGATARLDCYGSMTLPSTGLTWTATSPAQITFRSTATGKTITTNGVSLSNANIFFNGVGGGWTLGSALSYGGNNAFDVVNGTFNTGNYNITGGIFRVITAGTKIINLGSSTLALINTGNSLNFSQTTGLTFNAGTSQINFSGSTFTGGNQIFYDVSFTSTDASTLTINGANTFNNFNQASRNATGTKVISLSANQTISGTLTLGAANTAIRRIQVQSSVVGTQRTITLNGSLATLADCDFKDIVAAGSVGTWTGTRLGNGLGNSGITFDAPKDVYWNLAAGGNWSATGWALSSGGAINLNNFPLAQDKAIIENSGLNTSATITIDQAWWIGGLDLSTRNNAMTLASGTQTPRVYKDVMLSSAVTMTGTGAWSFFGQSSTQILDVNTATFVPPITIDSPNGSLELAENTTCSVTVTLTQGTLKIKDGATFTVGAFATSGTTQKFLQSTLAGTQATISQASGTVNASYLTIQDINATGGATWNAYVNQFNIDAGNTDGWDFGISPIVGGAEYTYALRSFTQPRRF